MRSAGLEQVLLTGSFEQNALEKELRFLTGFDPDRLLAGFRETAGLDTRGKKRYGGWESSMIGGHTMGHYLTACAQAYVCPGTDPQRKAWLLTMLETLVTGLRTCQQNSGGERGYLFGATLPDRERVELQFDNVEQGRSDIFREAWVPWYTMHKLLAGLLDVYLLAKLPQALETARELGMWVYRRTARWTPETKRRTLATEYGGMNDCLYTLYAVTGREEFARAAACFDETWLFERIASGEENVLRDLHANTTIPKFLGALNRYRSLHGRVLAGERVDAARYFTYAECFFRLVTERHTYITGGNSEWEHFGPEGILAGERTNANCETCNVYNMLKLAKGLFEVTGEAAYMDYYENAYYNTILSSQDPKTGMTTYFQPMAAGYFKVYSTPRASFWCCTGSGMENFTKLGDGIYFLHGGGIWVERYQSSELRLPEQGLTLRQRCGLPGRGEAEFTVSLETGETELYLRIPPWAGELRLTRNGCPVTGAEEQGYLVLRGVRGGERILLTMELRLTAQALPDDPGAIAFRYGPTVLSADLGRDDRSIAHTGVRVRVPAAPGHRSTTVALPKGVTLRELTDCPEACLTQMGDRPEFRLVFGDLVYAPHYLRRQERYGIYMDFREAE